MIRIRAIRDIFKPFRQNEVVCEIDEDVVDCKQIDNMPPWGHSDLEAFSSRPVDEYFDNIVDDWFAKPYNENVDIITGESFTVDPITGEQVTYEPPSSEPENIHEVMYDIATRSGSTTIQLDPIGGSENFQGGSENVHQ